MAIITYVQLLGASLPYNLGAKTSKIWRDFEKIFDYDREYLRNRSRYRKLETNLIDGNICGVQQNI